MCEYSSSKNIYSTPIWSRVGLLAIDSVALLELLRHSPTMLVQRYGGV